VLLSIGQGYDETRDLIIQEYSEVELSRIDVIFKEVTTGEHVDLNKVMR